MRFIYADFSMNASVGINKDNIEIRNFLGEKKCAWSRRLMRTIVIEGKLRWPESPDVVRRVKILQCVTVTRSQKVKKELVFDGVAVELVSRSSALINQVCGFFL